MSVLANRPEPCQSRPARKGEGTFAITFTINGDPYAVSLLPADPDVARKAYRLRKLEPAPDSDPATHSYDVRLTEHGFECECLGYLRWERCKHVQTLQAAAAVFNLT
jgi:hypothetical protein